MSMSAGEMAASFSAANRQKGQITGLSSNQARWYFTKEDLAQTPSIRMGLTQAKELSYRQQAANFIQDMGQQLRV